MENPSGTGGRKPPTSAELAAWRADDMARRAGKKVHQKGPSPIHGHVSLEESMRQDQALARSRAQAIGNDLSKMPDVRDSIHGRGPRRPGR